MQDGRKARLEEASSQGTPESGALRIIINSEFSSFSSPLLSGAVSTSFQIINHVGYTTTDEDQARARGDFFGSDMTKNITVN